MPVPRKVWLQTCVVMPAALARRRTISQALMRSSRSPVQFRRAAPIGPIFDGLEEGDPPGLGEAGALDEFRQIALQKVNTITPIKARYRSPTTPSVSMERSRSPASSAVSTGVLPLPSSWRGAGGRAIVLGHGSGDQVVEEHADGGHVLLEGGGRQAVGLGGLEIVAHVEGADVLHALLAFVLQEGEE